MTRIKPAARDGCTVLASTGGTHMANLEIDGIRLSGGATHEHITDIFGPAFGQKTQAEGVKEIEDGVNSFYVVSRGLLINDGVRVRVVHPISGLRSASVNGGRPYLRTVADGVDTNSLLALAIR
jgi:uncharacterized protein DUF3892